MRKWKKIIFNRSNKITKIIKVKNFEDFCKEDDPKHDPGEGSYKSNKYYQNKEFFFKFYLKDRYQILDNYLKNNLNREQKLLSIASGRAINELKFISNKFNVICSDLEIPQCYTSSKKLVGDFKYIKFNVINDKLNERFDCIFSLSACYLFSDVDLEKFFTNLNQNLKKDGLFILEFTGPEDNLISFFFHEIYLFFEAYLAYYISKITNLKIGLEFDKSFTYIRKNYEIINFAENFGFKFIDYQEYDYLTEIKRSILFRKILEIFPISKKIFIFLGKKLPYIRLFKFRKTS